MNQLVRLAAKTAQTRVSVAESIINDTDNIHDILMYLRQQETVLLNNDCSEVSYPESLKLAIQVTDQFARLQEEIRVISKWVSAIAESE